MTPDDTTVRRPLARSLASLRSSDLERREAAIGEVRALAKDGLSAGEVAAVIETASAELPKARHEWTTYDSELMWAISGHARDEHVPQLRRRYPSLSALGKPAALAALAGVGSATATRAYVQILREHGWPGRAPPAMTRPFERDCKFADDLLPAFVDGSITGLPDFDRYHLLLAYAVGGNLPGNVATAARPGAVLKARESLRQVDRLQRTIGIAWRFEEAYADHRALSGLLLDLLGHLGTQDEVVEVLKQAEKLHDPKPRLFAVLSLLRLGEEPRPQGLLEVASDPETRNLLLDGLTSQDKRDIFPASQLVQAKLAESDMVGWLIYPTELGRAPDHIELMDTIDVGREPAFAYYVFRFRTSPPPGSADEGWIAGISGPFCRDQMPTTESLGDTFSTFAKWDEFEAAKHLSSVTDLLTRWRARPQRR